MTHRAHRAHGANHRTLWTQSLKGVRGSKRRRPGLSSRGWSRRAAPRESKEFGRKKTPESRSKKARGAREREIPERGSEKKACAAQRRTPVKGERPGLGGWEKHGRKKSRQGILSMRAVKYDPEGQEREFFVTPRSDFDTLEWERLGIILWDAVSDGSKATKGLSRVWKVTVTVLRQLKAERAAAAGAAPVLEPHRVYLQGVPRCPLKS